MRELVLKFGSLTRITGSSYGKAIYEKQVKENIDWKEINKIIFPNSVNGISISFVQGLMDEIVNLSVYPSPIAS